MSYSPSCHHSPPPSPSAPIKSSILTGAFHILQLHQLSPLSPSSLAPIKSRLSTYAAYVDLRAAFDSISRPALWLLLKRAGVPVKIVTLIRALFDKSIRCVPANGLQSTWFEIMTGVRLGCVMCPETHLPQAWTICWREQSG